MTSPQTVPPADPAQIPPRRVGAMRAALASWRVTLPAITLNAATQALLVLPDPVPAVS